MGKEFKIGLAVVATVAIAFCGVLYQRVNKLKTTTAQAGNEQSTTVEKPKVDKLFATSQLDTASGDTATAKNDEGFRWNSHDRETPAAESATEHETVAAAPPRASFMPKEEPAVDDRYGSRYADSEASPPAEEAVVEAAPVAATPADPAASESTPAADARFGRIVADVAESTAPTAEASTTDSPAQPSASSNPFAKTLPAATAPPAAEAATEPTAAPVASDSLAASPRFKDASIEPAAEPAAEPPPTESQSMAEHQPPAAADTPTAQPRSIAIAQPMEQPTDQPLASEPAELSIPAEPTAPARLDPRTIPTGAISESTRLNSRFITPEEETPPTATGSRYADTYAEPPQRPTAPVAASPGRSIASGTYKLGPNENFWTVSDRAYGTGGYFKALHAYNAERYPIADELAVGDEIRVPERAELERLYPNLCPKPGRRSTRDSHTIQASARLKATGKTYVVQEGDTLFDIARYELGKAARWAELYELNREAVGGDIDFLRPGMELILPSDDDRSESLTREPGGTLR